MLVLLLLLQTALHVRAYPANINVSIACHELDVEASWDASEFDGGFVRRIEWNDASDSGCRKEGNWTSGMVSSKINFTTCASVIHQHNDTIVQENTAKVYVNYEVSIIERIVIYSFKVQCSLSRSVHAGGVSYNVTAKSIDLGVTNATTEFSVRMDIYTDNTYSSVMTNQVVSSFDPLYFGIYEMNNNPLLKFVTHTCYATRTADRNSAQKYIFFDDRCKVDESYEQTLSTNDRYNFKINAFRFIQLSTSVFVHCKLSVCKTNSTSDKCTQTKNCNRKRRDIRHRREVAEASDEPVEEITVMAEEVTILRPTCFEIMRDKKCPRFAFCEDLGERLPTCRCGDPYVYNQETNQCVNVRIVRVIGIHFDAAFKEEYGDIYRPEFLKLAKRIEDQLLFYIEKLDSNAIEGLKVVSAREGSIVVDVDLAYAATSSEEAAYQELLKSIQKTHVDRFDYPDKLEIKPIQPTLKRALQVPPEGSDKPSDPAQPVQPNKPGKPVIPDEPVVPVIPVLPARPDDVGDTKKPDKSSGGMSSRNVLLLSIVVPVAGVLLLALLIAVVVKRNQSSKENVKVTRFDNTAYQN